MEKWGHVVQAPQVSSEKRVTRDERMTGGESEKSESGHNG